MNILVIRTSLFFLLSGLVSCASFGQKNEPNLNKIIISLDSLLYYSVNIEAIGKVYSDYKINRINEIYKKKKKTEYLMFKDAQLRRVKFGDSEVNANFVISGNDLITLSLQKPSAFHANSEMEYWIDPWVIRYKCINVTNEENIRSNSFSDPTIQLDHSELLHSFIPSPIFCDFFEYKNDVFLMILADHTLYLYESAGSLVENQWQLKKAFPDLKFQSFFRAYKDESCNLILYFGSNESYCIDLENDSISLIATIPHEDKCLVHNHLTDEFLWLTPTQAEELITSDEPAKYINQFKRE